MKTTFQIRTGDFEYIMQEYEKLSPEEAIEKFSELKTKFNGGFGLDAKDFDTFIQNQLNGVDNHTDTIEQLSSEQMKMYQINKRALSRINYKLKK